MVEVFRQIKRVLKHDGTVWLNLGDSYAASSKGKGGKTNSTLNAKRDEDGNLSDDRKSQPWMEETKKFDLNKSGLNTMLEKMLFEYESGGDFLEYVENRPMQEWERKLDKEWTPLDE
jgi:hypothetical protein